MRTYEIRLLANQTRGSNTKKATCYLIDHRACFVDFFCCWPMRNALCLTDTRILAWMFLFESNRVFLSCMEMAAGALVFEFLGVLAKYANW